MSSDRNRITPNAGVSSDLGHDYSIPYNMAPSPNEWQADVLAAYARQNNSASVRPLSSADLDLLQSASYQFPDRHVLQTQRPTRPLVSGPLVSPDGHYTTPRQRMCDASAAAFMRPGADSLQVNVDPCRSGSKSVLRKQIDPPVNSEYFVMPNQANNPLPRSYYGNVGHPTHLPPTPPVVAGPNHDVQILQSLYLASLKHNAELEGRLIAQQRMNTEILSRVNQLESQRSTTTAAPVSSFPSTDDISSRAHHSSSDILANVESAAAAPAASTSVHPRSSPQSSVPHNAHVRSPSYRTGGRSVGASANPSINFFGSNSDSRPAHAAYTGDSLNDPFLRADELRYCRPNGISDSIHSHFRSWSRSNAEFPKDHRARPGDDHYFDQQKWLAKKLQTLTFGVELAYVTNADEKGNLSPSQSYVNRIDTLLQQVHDAQLSLQARDLHSMFNIPLSKPNVDANMPLSVLRRTDCSELFFRNKGTVNILTDWNNIRLKDVELFQRVVHSDHQQLHPEDLHSSEIMMKILQKSCTVDFWNELLATKKTLKLSGDSWGGISAWFCAITLLFHTPEHVLDALRLAIDQFEKVGPTETEGENIAVVVAHLLRVLKVLYQSKGLLRSFPKKLRHGLAQVSCPTFREYFLKQEASTVTTLLVQRRTATRLSPVEHHQDQIFDECVTLLETARDLYYAFVDQCEWIDASGKALQSMTVTTGDDDISVTDDASTGEPVEDDSSVSNCSAASDSTAETDAGWDPETQTWKSEEQKEAADRQAEEFSEDHCDQKTVERIAKEYQMSLDSSAHQKESDEQKEDPSCPDGACPRVGVARLWRPAWPGAPAQF